MFLIRYKNIIEPSNSAWNSSLVPVLKASRKIRWCQDFRGLNEATVRDCHPIGDCIDSLSRLGRSRVFSVIDGESAFHAIEIKPEHRHYTAFSTPFGVYQFRQMAFGLTNAPATYSRLVRRVLDGIPWSVAMPYLDDTIIHSRSVSEHVQHLGQVLEAFHKAGLKLGPSRGPAEGWSTG